MGLILLGVLLVIVGFLVNALDLLPGTILRVVGWVLIIVGVVVAFLDILADAAWSRPGAALGSQDTKFTFILWGIGLIVLGLLVDIFTSAGGGLLRTLGLLLVLAGIILAFIDIAREPRHRRLRYRA